MMNPGMAAFTSRSAGRLLRAGDVIRQFDGTFHYVQYVNSSGAYAVPLAGLTRVINGHTANFTAGGRTISAHSLVEIINPLAMGGNSPEYHRYAKMEQASREEGMAKRKKSGTPEQGVTFDEFDPTELDEEYTSRLANAGIVPITDKETKSMAKKAAKANGKPAAAREKKEKAPKTVRACACACGGQTTGSFVPGHDARMHGWIKKLGDGRLEPKEIPASVRAKLGLVQTKTGFKASNPHFWQDVD